MENPKWKIFFGNIVGPAAKKVDVALSLSNLSAKLAATPTF